MSPHLLSLPAETLGTIVSFLVYPIDAYNLSRTCRYFHMTLMSHSNFYWYNLVRRGNARLMFDWPYDPTQDYYYDYAKEILLDSCHMCFTDIGPRDLAGLRRRGIGPGDRIFGLRICFSCFIEHTITAPGFSLFGLDIETNPPKSEDLLVPCRYGSGKVFVQYYWKPDIDSLCNAQKGLSLSTLRKIWARQIAREESVEQSCMTWKRRCTFTVKTALADRVWQIWSENAQYAYARGTFATDLTKETFKMRFGLTAEHESADSPLFLHWEFREATSNAAFAKMDQVWIDNMATELLMHMQDSTDFRARCRSWHRQRFKTELEKARTLPVGTAKLRDRCHLCRDRFQPPGVVGFLYHMEDYHEEFWVDGSWSIVERCGKAKVL